jgi:hypothetical protein
MEFIHKLFDHANKRYIMGYNPLLILSVFGDLVFPISMMLWLPKTHSQYRSKNDMTVDFITHLHHESEQRGCTLDQVEMLFDSAYCKQKVVSQAQQAGLNVISKPSNNHKFEWEGEWFTPKELIEQVKERCWKFLEKNHDHQRVMATHPIYGSVILIIRRRMLKNKKVIYDVVMSTKVVYNGFQIHKRYRKRWEIGVSREGRLNPVGESPTEVTSSSLVAWEAPWREIKTVKPSDTMLFGSMRKTPGCNVQ